MPSGVPPMPSSRSMPVSGAGRHDGAGDVAVGDELDPGAGGPDLLGQLLVPGPVEQHDGDVVGLRALGLGDPADVLGDRVADVDDVGGLGAGDELLHVEHRGRVVHRAARRRPPAPRWRCSCPWRPAWCRRSGRPRRRTRGRCRRRPARRCRASGRCPSRPRRSPRRRASPTVRDQRAHRVDRGAVGAVLVAAADPAAGGHGGGLGDPDQLEGEVAVGRLGCPACSDGRFSSVMRASSRGGARGCDDGELYRAPGPARRLIAGGAGDRPGRQVSDHGE